MSKIREALETLQLSSDATLVFEGDVEQVALKTNGRVEFLSIDEAIARAGLAEKAQPVNPPADKEGDIITLDDVGRDEELINGIAFLCQLPSRAVEAAQEVIAKLDLFFLDQGLWAMDQDVSSNGDDIGLLDWRSRSPLNALRTAGFDTVGKLKAHIELYAAVAVKGIGPVYEKAICRALQAEHRDWLEDEGSLWVARMATPAAPEVDPGQFHGEQKAKREHQAAKANRVPVARFKSNGDSFYRVLETGSAGEVAQLKNDIKTRFDGRARAVYATLQVRWETNPALCI